MNINYIIDTNILIDILRDKKKANFLDPFISKGQILCSVLTKSEILAGVREKEREDTEKLISKIAHIEVSYEIANIAGEYLNKYLKSFDIDIVDAIIAASAKVIGGIVVTKNIKHYPMSDIEIIRIA